MAAQQSASRKKGREWLILARGASPGRNKQSECLAKQSRNLFSAPEQSRARKGAVESGSDRIPVASPTH